MGRLRKTTAKKHVSCECIFCDYDYQRIIVKKSVETSINYFPVPPLGKRFYGVCTNCEPTLNYFINKYPELFN